MQWKEYRLTRTRVATSADEGITRRVLELFDGRMLIEREGAPAQIVDGSFEQAKTSAAALALPVPPSTPWWRRFWRAVFGW